MKKYLTTLTVVGIMVSVMLIPTACSPLSMLSNIDWVDFIKLNDITYISEHQNVSIDESNLTLFSKIKFKVADKVFDSSYKIKNGDAAYLEVGTPVYSLAGYSPNFRLVARQNQDLIIYEADSNPNAKKGSDILDIGGKVEYIGINSEIDRTTELASINDRSQIDELVQMIVDAHVDQSSSKAGAERYFLEFHFKDGTITNRSYRLDTGELQRGIQLPEKFGQLIRMALPASIDTNNSIIPRGKSTKITPQPGDRVSTSSALLVSMDIDTLIKKSDCALVGNVTSILPSKNTTEHLLPGFSESGMMMVITNVIIKPERYLFGGKDNNPIAVRVEGGRIDNYTLVAEDEPVFTEGENVLVFLYHPDWMNASRDVPQGIDRFNYYLVQGMIQGQYQLQDGEYINPFSGKALSISDLEQRVTDLHKME